MGHSPAPSPSLLSTEARLGYQSKDLEEAKAGEDFEVILMIHSNIITTTVYTIIIYPSLIYIYIHCTLLYVYIYIIHCYIYIELYYRHIIYIIYIHNYVVCQSTLKPGTWTRLCKELKRYEQQEVRLFVEAQAAAAKAELANELSGRFWNRGVS